MSCHKLYHGGHFSSYVMIMCNTNTVIFSCFLLLHDSTNMTDHTSFDEEDQHAHWRTDGLKHIFYLDNGRENDKRVSRKIALTLVMCAVCRFALSVR